MQKGEASNSSTEKDSVIIHIPEFDNWAHNVIFRVPRKLRDLKEKAYTPQLVSIGPFHHGREELKRMESHKEKYLKKFCERAMKTEHELLNFTEGKSEDIWKSYAGTFQIKREDFNQMILTDACFIFELFSRDYEQKERDYKRKQGDYQRKLEDYLVGTAWLRGQIALDLQMLENQIPFSFLEELYIFSNPRLYKREEQGECKGSPCKSPKCTSCWNSDSTTEEPSTLQHHTKSDSTTEEQSTLQRLTINFFNSPQNIDVKHINHFTDLARLSRLPLDAKPKNPDIAELENLYTATKLDKAGVYFASSLENLYSATKLDKAGVYFASSLENVPLAKVTLSDSDRPCWSNCIPCFRSLQLELSQFTIDDDTECIFRNILALEQCFYPLETYICNYVFLMSELIDTEEDVDLLVEKKIINNLLGSNKKAVDLINELGDNISIGLFNYLDECKQLNDFYEKWYNRFKANFKRIYFKDAWTSSTTIVAFFIFIFSISSTMKSLIDVISFFKD